MKLSFNETDIFEWGVDEVIGIDTAQAAIREGRTLRVKLGIDPTSSAIHLGRATVLWRLRAFQELGHHICLLIGDFTGQVGDTSDKDAERPMLSREAVTRNLERYLEQVWMVLNPDRKDQVSVSYNSTWLQSLSFGEVSVMADAFSVNQFIKRELVARRLESGSRVSLREMLYPLMQGYDSVILKADVELGGTDQRFNMLAGRILQEQAGQTQQAVIMQKLISGTDGRKMSSSWGNVISLLDTPQDMFAKMMAVRDDRLEEYLLVFPRSAAPFTSEELRRAFASGENPRDIKMRFAEQLVALYHGEEVASRVKAAFISQFSQGNKPEDIPEKSRSSFLVDGAADIALVDLLVAAELAASKSEARRLVEQGGVRLNDNVITDTGARIQLTDETLIQVGKRRFLRLV